MQIFGPIYSCDDCDDEDNFNPEVQRIAKSLLSRYISEHGGAGVVSPNMVALVASTAHKLALKAFKERRRQALLN